MEAIDVNPTQIPFILEVNQAEKLGLKSENAPKQNMWSKKKPKKE